MTLKDYGIGDYIRKHQLCFDSNLYRITARTYSSFIVQDRSNQSIEVHFATKETDLVVGDYVQVEKVDGNYFITKRFERDSLITKASSTAKKSYTYNDKEQSLAANVDQLFIIIAADQRFSLSKFERYFLTFSHMVDDIQVIVSKSDYVKESAMIRAKILSAYPDIRLFDISVYSQKQLNVLKSLFIENSTSILIGSSGVGKSTLINYLMDKPLLTTQPVRSDGKGKHTTTSSYLYYLDSTASYIIDTPGFKTISTHRKTDDSQLFQKIYDLSLNCKFNDCSHISEPGCAIQRALKSGELSSTLYERYLTVKDKEKRLEKFLHSKQKNKKTKKPMKIITKFGNFKNDY